MVVRPAGPCWEALAPNIFDMRAVYRERHAACNNAP